MEIYKDKNKTEKANFTLVENKSIPRKKRYAYSIENENFALIESYGGEFHIFGDIWVKIFGTPTVYLYDEVFVHAFGCTKVIARDDTFLQAYNYCFVEAYDESYIQSFHFTNLKANDMTKFRGYDDANIIANDYSIGTVYHRTTLKNNSGRYIRDRRKHRNLK